MAKAKFKEAEKVGDASILKVANGLNSALEQLYGSCALNPRKINTVMTWKTVFLNKRYVYKLFYGLGPERRICLFGVSEERYGESNI